MPVPREPKPGLEGASSSVALSDLAPEGLLHVALVRAPIARGSLLGIESDPLPRGYRLLTAKDIPGANRLLSFGVEIPILADNQISYEGEPLALLVGPDPGVLEDIRHELRFNLAPEEARLDWKSFSSEQVVCKRVVTQGDPDLAFSIAASVVETDYSVGPIEHFYSEPQGALALFDYDKLVLRVATQWPYHVRDSVALALGCKSEEVRVRPTRLGVHLDGKLWYPSLLACHAALAARICGAPARVLLTREEDFRYSPKRAESAVTVRAALDPAAKLSALDVRISLNVGAYAPLAEELLSQTCIAATGLYACPNLRIEGYAVSTNSPPAGAFGGLGAAHSFFALEAATARLAEESGEDPMDWKSRNLLVKGSPLVTGEALKESPPYTEIASRLAAMSDFRRKYACYELIRKRRTGKDDGPLRGIGFAFAYQGAGVFLSEDAPNAYAVEAELDKDLHVLIKTSAVAAGGGVIEIWRRTAAEVLGISPEAVAVAEPDTEDSPNSGPITLSRGISVVNRLVERACSAIQRRRFRDPLPIATKSVYRVPKPPRWNEGKVEGVSFDSASWGGAVVELELDPWSLEPKPLGVWLCIEGGRIVSPERAAERLRASAANALGLSLREGLVSSEGSILPEAYYRYSMTPLSDLPPIAVEFAEGGRKSLAKGIGELPFDTVPAAFLAALGQAAGAPFSTLPVSPEEIITAVEEA